MSSDVTAEVGVGGDDGDAHIGAEADGPAWIDAVLHPERFFRSPRIRLGGAGVVAVLAFGAISTASAIVARARDLGHGRTASTLLLSTWLGFLSGALVPGVMRWCFGAFSYWVRVRWSGAKQVGAGESWGVAGICLLLQSSPFVAGVLAGAIRLETPLQVMRAGETWLGMLSSLGVEGWAIWVAYQAGITRHELRPGRARFWLLVVPATFAIGLNLYLRRHWFG